MNITVNGTLHDINIGCRTMTSLNMLVDILEIRLPEAATILLNGVPLSPQAYRDSLIKSGDSIQISR